MRILMISDVYFPRINGVSTSIQTFSKHLSALNHDITLIAPEYTDSDERNDSLFRIPSRYMFVDPEDRMMKIGHVYSLEEQLKNKKFDLIHIQTPFVAHYAGIKLSRLLGLPKVETYHTHFEEYLYHYLPYMPKSFMRFATRFINRTQCNGVDALVVPSTAMLKTLQDYGINRPIEIIATGIEEEFFVPGNGVKFRRKYNIDIDRPVLVHIGRVAHEKNIDFLIYALAEIKRTIPDVLLIIAGEGPAEKKLKQLTEELGLKNNILFVGYLDRGSEIMDCYKAGNAFVFASKTETQGLVLLEAMAQGTPVVSLAALGTTDILMNGQGAIIAKDDIQDFSEKTVQLLQDEHLQEQLSISAIKYAQTWSARTLAEKKAGFYQETIDKHILN